MPGKPWTTPAQDVFLHGFDTKFIEKQEEGTLESWFPTVYEQFFAKWPEQDPDELISVRLRGKDVMQTRLQVRKHKIYHWYFNHCKPTATGKLLNLGKKPRVLQGYQAYQRVAGATLKPQLEEEYERYWRALGEDDKRENEFTWRNQRAIQLFGQETDEMKAKVEEYRREHRFQVDSDDSDSESDSSDEEGKAKAKVNKAKKKEKKISRSLDRLTYTLDVALKNIEAQTGWVSSVFVGGWDPRKKCISTFSVHNGKSKAAGLEWFQDEGFKTIDNSWRAFVEKVKANGGTPDEQAQNTDTRGTTAPVTNTRGVDEGNSKKTKDTESDASKKRPTQTKEDSTKGDSGKSHATSSRQRGQGQDRKGKGRARERKQTPSSESDSSESDSDDESDDAMVIDGDDNAKWGNSSEPGESDDESDDEPAVQPENADDAKLNSVLAALEEALKKAKEEAKEGNQHQATYQVFAKFSKRVSKKFPNFDVQRRLNVAMNRVYCRHLGIHDDVQGMASDKGKKKPVKKGKAKAKALPQRSSPRKKPAEIDWPDPSSAKPLPTPESDKSATGSQPGPSSTSPTENVIGSATQATNDPKLAKWMVKPLEAFNEEPATRAKAWKKLLDTWVSFEQSHAGQPSTKMRLSRAGRPDELTSWISAHRKFDRPPKWESKTLLKGYGVSMTAWWKMLQPHWRDVEKTWPAKREPEDDDSWGSLCCAGTNGVFLVVVGMLWWLNALGGKPSKELATLLDDVEWAMSRMTSQEDEAASTSKKRQRTPTGRDRRAAKRARLS